MRRALALAARGLGRTSPNPAVGAVVVREGQTVGEGWHQAAGEPHAEVEALQSAGEQARGASLYVTLEPCSHRGRTPPCTEVLIKAEVARVVYACSDCDERSAGQADRILKEAGVEVACGLLADEAQRLNEAYFKHKTTGLPLVTLKLALTLDGRVATRTGQSHWITGEAARQRVHELRNRSDAVAVGIGTVLADDPRLTVRLEGEDTRNPVRVIVDTGADTPPQARILSQPGQTIIAVGEKAEHKLVASLEQVGAEVILLSQCRGRVDLPELLYRLGERDIMSLVVEGGPTIAGGLLHRGLVDKLILFYAPKILGDEEALPAVRGRRIEELSASLNFRLERVEQIGPDLMVTAYPCSPD